jgi:hypothetical protein
MDELEAGTADRFKVACLSKGVFAAIELVKQIPLENAASCCGPLATWSRNAKKSPTDDQRSRRLATKRIEIARVMKNLSCDDQLERLIRNRQSFSASLNHGDVEAEHLVSAPNGTASDEIGWIQFERRGRPPLRGKGETLDASTGTYIERVLFAS